VFLKTGILIIVLFSDKTIINIPGLRKDGAGLAQAV
jgi:hypothetical protein